MRVTMPKTSRFASEALSSTRSFPWLPLPVSRARISFSCSEALFTATTPNPSGSKRYPRCSQCVDSRIFRIKLLVRRLPSKEKRPLGIPTVRDRVVQTALVKVLEPIFERDFAQHSYGFRPKHLTTASDGVCANPYGPERAGQPELLWPRRERGQQTEFRLADCSFQ